MTEESKDEKEKSKESDKKTEKNKKAKKPGTFGITREIVHTVLVFVALITCLITRYSLFS